MSGRMLLYTATLITAHSVIPANAGIQERTGFRVKPGMTNRKGLIVMNFRILLFSAFCIFHFAFDLFPRQRH